MPRIFAFTANVSAGADNVQLDAVQGTAEYVQNNRLVLDRDQFLLWAYIQGASITRARIDSPSLRTYLLPRFPLVRRGTSPGSEPPVNDFSGYGLVLRSREEIAIQTSNDLGTGSERHHAIICVGDAPGGGVRAPEFWIRATGSTTLVPNQWTNVPLAFEQTLPAGNYRITGLILRSATGIAGRVVIPGQGDRHGTLCINAVGQEPNRFLLGARYGDYGVFSSVALPSVEFLATGADTSQEVYLGIVRA
jgi:hypothetical protein